METITSRKNPLVLWAASLAEKKFREREHAFIADGYKLFEEAVASQATILHVFICEDKKEQYLQSTQDMLSSAGQGEVPISLVSRSCFEKISSEKAPQGILAIVKYLDKVENIIKIYKVKDITTVEEKTLFLASVRDPSNLGAILRSAAAFGCQRIVMSADCADPYSQRCVRAAMGALFRLRLTRTEDLAAAVGAYREAGRRVLAAELAPRAISLGESAFTSRDIVIIGNEGHGIPEDVSSACDGSIFIPISATTESLNAAVAASIFLWEMRK